MSVSDLDAVVTFYAPHPGFMGAATPLPSAVKKVVDELDDKSMSLREAVGKIQAVTKGKVRVDKKGSAIFLQIGSDLNYVQHVWRLIRYK